MGNVGGEDVGTFARLGCHWKRWESLREKLRIKKKMEVRLWGNEREGRSFCSEKERKEVEELENMKRWGRWREWKEKKCLVTVGEKWRNENTPSG